MTDKDPWQEMKEIGEQIFPVKEPEPTPVIKVSITLSYPTGSEITEEIGEILTMPPEETYEDFIYALAELLQATGLAFVREHHKAVKEGTR